MIVNAGRNHLFNVMLGKEQPGDFVLHLFRNDQYPSRTDTALRYQEVQGGGYAAIPLHRNGWQIEDGVARYADQRWEFVSRIGMVYGTYLTLGGLLIAAERFEKGPFDVRVMGDRITVPIALTWGGG